MEIFYVRYDTDNPQEDGIWLFKEGERQFFLDYDAAEAEAARLNDEEYAHWVKRDLEAQEKWKKTEAAYDALENVGLNPRDVFPYHRRIWESKPPKNMYVVDSLQVT